MVITATTGTLRRYRFGLGITDMLICGDCGVYVAAMIEQDGRTLATLNANILDIRDALDPVPQLVSYAGEAASDRVKRRFARWTPMRLEVPDG